MVFVVDVMADSIRVENIELFSGEKHVRMGGWKSEVLSSSVGVKNF